MAEFIHFEASEGEESEMEMVTKTHQKISTKSSRMAKKRPAMEEDEESSTPESGRHTSLLPWFGEIYSGAKRRGLMEALFCVGVDVSKMKRTTKKRDVEKNVNSDEEEESDRKKKRGIKKTKIIEDEDSEEEIDITRSEKMLEFSAQKAMGMLTKMCDAFSVKWQGSSIQPLDSIWPKLASSYVRRFHPDFRATFSTFESINWQIGRFLASMIYFKSDLSPKFIPGGVYVWRHGWNEKNGNFTPKCLHGVEMSPKPRTVELSAVSEAGKRAIGENGANIEKNKYGKPVVILRFENNVVCFKDASHGGFPNPHASGSCAMVFSDSEKAINAMKHDIEWTKAIYPNVEKFKIEDKILIAANCFCNYASETVNPGRQICKIVPYKMNGADDISDEIVKVRKDMAAHKTYRHTMVFLCCNPNVGGRGNSNTSKVDKSCGWKLSATDLRFAYIFANEIYKKVFNDTSGVKLTEFKWNSGFAFKTEVIQPAIIQECTEIF